MAEGENAASTGAARRLPRIPDLGQDPKPGIFKRAVKEHQSVYLRTSAGEQQALLVVFLTMHRTLGMSYTSLLEAARATGHDLLFLNDQRQDFLTRGIKEWGLSVADSIAAIRAFAEARGKTAIDTIGHSSGATSCLFYSTQMPVRRCVLFNPFTSFQGLEHISSNVVAGFLKRVVDNLAQHARLEGQGEKPEDYHINLRNWIADSPYRAEYVVHYSNQHPGNVKQVDNIADLPNVRVRGWKYRKHDLPLYLQREGKLVSVLTGLLTVGDSTIAS